MTYYGKAVFTDDAGTESEVQAVLAWTHAETGLRDLVGSVYWVGDTPGAQGVLRWPQGPARVRLIPSVWPGYSRHATVELLGDIA